MLHNIVLPLPLPLGGKVPRLDAYSRQTSRLLCIFGPKGLLLDSYKVEYSRETVCKTSLGQ